MWNEYVCYAKQKVQVPTFEWDTFEILGYGGHKYVCWNVEIFITDESSTFMSYPQTSQMKNSKN